METKPKRKLCKRCEKPFLQFNSLQKTCSEKCLRKLNEEKDKERKKIKREKKAVSVAALKAKLWKLFSEYIRRKYSDCHGNAGCVTCGAVKPWKDMQAGHFVPAGSSNYLRFVESNVHVQCYSCNVGKHSNPIEYRIFMVNTYGEEFVEKLVSLRNEVKRFTSEELSLKIKEYEEKLEKLEK